MRALILVAGAALAVSACSSNEAADNTMNVDNLAVDNLVVNDTGAMDANMDMNATVDANAAADAANSAADAANNAADAANAATAPAQRPHGAVLAHPVAVAGSASHLPLAARADGRPAGQRSAAPPPP